MAVATANLVANELAQVLLLLGQREQDDAGSEVREGRQQESNVYEQVEVLDLGAIGEKQVEGDENKHHGQAGDHVAHAQGR